MTKNEMIDNLGTIAKSGSKEFLKENKSANNNDIADQIIGQFGVGFYSSFIVADNVQVFSKSYKEDKTHLWESDGSGNFEISEVEIDNFARGTRIVVNLKPDNALFSNKEEVKKIV